MIRSQRFLITTVLVACASLHALGDDMTADVQPASGVHLVPLGKGIAKNSVNVVIFRKQSLATFRDTQFASYYDADGHVALAKRKLGENVWQTERTSLTGTTKDAHNAINLGVDGDGFLHVAWDHHNNPLNYRRSKEPLSLHLEPATMTGQDERSVRYPEFHLLPDGDLLFLYRDGASGRGNLAMNRYEVKTKTWRRLTSKLVDGEGQRNAYWQACTDAAGTVHVSWVWRESPDVSTNHDMCYARSSDGGRTWTKSTGETYALPITAATAEYAAKIPQQHELMNQTSMTADASGRPYIATYFRPEGSDIPQYFLIYHDGSAWHTTQAGELTTRFRLGGGGTKRAPISRPQILFHELDGKLTAHLIFRAEERGGRASLATCDDLVNGQWTMRDLTSSSLGQWEPTYDPVVWQRDRVLHLFVERVEQVDAEGVGALPPQMVYVAEVKP
jgi:hypothetical protein